MSQVTVGLVDYGIGNHASIVHSLRELDVRVRISSEASVLEGTDLLVLPGVGAFPAAMQALHRQGLVAFLREQAHSNRPIIGICLGMQLLATGSYEFQYTEGLDIIPGEVVELSNAKWHIGWNTLTCSDADPLLRGSNGQSFYFNHSFGYQGPDEYKIGMTEHFGSRTAIIRKGRVVGLQFHPEKSQACGKALLQTLMLGLLHA